MNSSSIEVKSIGKVKALNGKCITLIQDENAIF